MTGVRSRHADRRPARPHPARAALLTLNLFDAPA
jgi:hypothetical protein